MNHPAAPTDLHLREIEDDQRDHLQRECAADGLDSIASAETTANPPEPNSPRSDATPEEDLHPAAHVNQYVELVDQAATLLEDAATIAPFIDTASRTLNLAQRLRQLASDISNDIGTPRVR